MYGVKSRYESRAEGVDMENGDVSSFVRSHVGYDKT